MFYLLKIKGQSLLHGGDYNPEQWLDDPGTIDLDFKMFKEAGINTITVGIFSWSMLEPREGVYQFEWLDDIFDRAERQGMSVILATPSGARPAWLARKYPEVLRVDERNLRQGFGGRHNHCFTSPVYRRKTQEINRKLAVRYGKRKSLVLWHVSNELSGECRCELCQEAFRDWLRKRYGSLDNLNRVWWNTFWSHRYDDWSEVMPPSPVSELGNKGMNLDWKRFVTDQTLSFFENEIRPLREITPDVPITTNFMSGGKDMEPFAGFDYQKFSRHLDVISWDSYPAWGNDYETTPELGMKVSCINDFFRSLKHQNFLIMENTPSRVNWQDYNRGKRPGMHVLASVQDIAQGSDSVLYFQLRQSRGSAEMFHGAVIEHDNSTENRVFKDVAHVGEILGKLGEVKKTSHKQADVAILYDYENYWALSDCESYSRDRKLYWQTLQKHYEYFYKHDIPVDFVSPEDDFEKYRILIDPLQFMLPQRLAEKLNSFVKNGGTLVGTYLSGVVDESDLAYMNGGNDLFNETYGCRIKETDVLYPTQKNKLLFDGKEYEAVDFCGLIETGGAEVMAEYGSDFYDGTPAVTENVCGKGTAYMIGCRTDSQFINDFYDRILEECGFDFKNVFTKSSAKVSVQVRENSDERFYFVLNFADEGSESVSFDRNLKDVLNGEEISDVHLAPYEVRILSEKI